MSTAAVPTPISDDVASTSLHSGRREGWMFRAVCGGAAWSSVAMLVLLLSTILWMGAGRLSWDFLTRYDSAVNPDKAGVLAGLWGSFWLMILTMLLSVPVGVGAAIYLEEYASENWLTRLIRINLANLAGVPSIVYGILGLTAVVRMFGVFDGTSVQAINLLGVRVPLPLGSCVLSGALTLGLLVLPVVIVASQEALRAVPSSIREASFALGATKWQTIRHQLLPASLPGILTGVILAVSRAVGETAPLIMVGAAVFYRHSPGGIESPWQLITSPGGLTRAPFDDYTALPMVVYNWAKQPTEAYQYAAAAGIVVLLVSLLVLNALAIYIRNRYQRRMAS
ncbi:MAG: phosphate ABC transporter permease PstA [Planctomycetaceae bacterium]|nr:phosphate ABC transporter permease PstA [Planctomycetaceae bacterium]